MTKSRPTSCIICQKEYSSKGIFTHFLHAHDPSFKNDWIDKNRESKSKIAERITLENQQKLINKINLYNKNHKLCFCGAFHTYDTRKNKYCSASCAATSTNNIRNPRTQESRNKTATSLTGHKRSTPREILSCSISFTSCTVCNKTILHKVKTPIRKTCSRSCQTIASVGNRTYINGRRLNIYYFNINENKTILLESSWEHDIAKFLDTNNIIWIRPTPIGYVDENKKSRLYFPDFYLPQIDTFLDPKNPYGMKCDAYKIKQVSKQISILVGDKEKMKSDILEIWSDQRITISRPPAPKAGALPPEL